MKPASVEPDTKQEFSSPRNQFLHQTSATWTPLKINYQVMAKHEGVLDEIGTLSSEKKRLMCL